MLIRHDWKMQSLCRNTDASEPLQLDLVSYRSVDKLGAIQHQIGRQVTSLTTRRDYGSVGNRIDSALIC